MARLYDLFLIYLWDYSWACDVWDANVLDNQSLCRLQANKDWLYCKTTNKEQANALIEKVAEDVRELSVELETRVISGSIKDIKDILDSRVQIN